MVCLVGQRVETVLTPSVSCPCLVVVGHFDSQRQVWRDDRTVQMEKKGGSGMGDGGGIGGVEVWKGRAIKFDVVGLDFSFRFWSLEQCNFGVCLFVCLLQLYCHIWISPMGKSGRFPSENPAAIESYNTGTTYSACRIFLSLFGESTELWYGTRDL